MKKPRRQTKREINWLQFHGLIKRASQPIKNKAHMLVSIAGRELR